MIPDQLRIRPGQESLSTEQEAEARRFAQARIKAQLSTDPVDEPEAEALLKQAYTVVKLPAPRRIHWVDGPLQLVQALASPHGADSEEADAWGSVLESVDERVGKSVVASVLLSVEDSVAESLGEHVWGSVLESVELQANVETSVRPSVRAYEVAPWLAYARFFDEYLAPNALHALAHFNEQVSGYWLGKRGALVVRRPRLLTRDAAGRLHSATSRCIEYHDGWGFYAWHGVRVPERVILAPEKLTREGYLREPNVEVRRVMQELMGERFVEQLGGVVIDSGPRGTLYEVVLPDDPERVARYVQVQDASTKRRYFLRVPPTIQTAEEAVAWTFQVAAADYRPAQET